MRGLSRDLTHRLSIASQCSHIVLVVLFERTTANAIRGACLPMRRLCPVCVYRQDNLVSPDCVVCEGRGFLTLGEGALSFYSPNTVAQAVSYALEAVARNTDLTRNLSENRRRPIQEAVAVLYDAGVLTRPTTPPPPRPRTRKPRKRDERGLFVPEMDPLDVAQSWVQEPLLPLDAALQQAPCFTYGEDDRPNARGLPLLSANGHPSHLSRVCDPAEPGGDSPLTFRLREAQSHQASVLATAAQEAARRRNRRAQRKDAA